MSDRIEEAARRAAEAELARRQRNRGREAVVSFLQGMIVLIALSGLTFILGGFLALLVWLFLRGWEIFQ